MNNNIETIKEVFVAPYPNSAFMLLQVNDLLGCIDTEKGKKAFTSNMIKLFTDNFPSLLKLFPAYKYDDLFRAIQIIPDCDYSHRIVYFRNAIVLALVKAEGLDFDLDNNMDSSTEVFSNELLKAIKKKSDQLNEQFKSNDSCFSFSRAYVEYCCKKFNVDKRDPALYVIMLREKIREYDAIIESSTAYVLKRDGKATELPSLLTAMSEMSVTIGWSYFDQINPAKFELAMANRFIIDFNSYIRFLEREVGSVSPELISESAPEYLDFLLRFVNNYNNKLKENQKYGLAIKTIEPKNGNEMTLSHEQLVKKASKILNNYPVAIDMGSPLSYDGIPYSDVKAMRNEKIEILQEEALIRAASERIRLEQEKERLEKEKAAREKQRQLEEALEAEEEIINREISEAAIERDGRIEELLLKIGKLITTSNQYSEELNIWKELLIEEKRAKAKAAAVQVVKVGGKLFTPSEAQEFQIANRECEEDLAKGNNDSESLKRIEELSRRQEFYYKNLDIIAVIKFDDMDIYVSSSGCLYTEPANQSGVGHNAVYVLNYTNAKQLFSRGLVKQEVRSDKSYSESGAIKYFPHIDGWENRLIAHNAKANSKAVDKDGILHFIDDIKTELGSSKEKTKLFDSGKCSNSRARN